jgi:hypothetical protein
MASLTGEFEVTSWNEEPYAQRDGERKLTHASVTQTLSGGVTGTGAVEWLMSYQEDGTARFVGLQQLDGEIEGRAGSVVLDTVGDFDGKEAAGSWTRRSRLRHRCVGGNARGRALPGAHRPEGELHP